MDKFFSTFYYDLYRRTRGFMPAKPLNQSLYPGDFFQIINGEMIVLGNIFRNRIVEYEDCPIHPATQLNPANWNFYEGVSKPFSAREFVQKSEDDFKYSKQLLSFERFGSFFFKSNGVESVKLSDWSAIKNQLIIRMTQVMYSFRELYIVTESAVAANWTLAISGSENGELELATDQKNFGLIDLFGHESARTIQARDIEYYYREAKRKPNFFKAKKLIVNQEKLDTFISELIYNHQTQAQWVIDFFDYNFEVENTISSLNFKGQASLLDMLQANELNPNTALLYFDWMDANSDDIDKLFR
jgi:hypothetical protein